jgi:hypothetical protein
VTEDEKGCGPVGYAVIERDIAREHPRQAQQLLKPVSVALERNREIRVDEMKAGTTSCAAV